MEKALLILALVLTILAFSLAIPRPVEPEPVVIYLPAKASGDDLLLEKSRWE